MITNQCNRHITPSFHAKVVAYATEMAEALMLEWGHDFDLHIATKNRGTSRGGWKGIKICDRHFSGKKRKYKFVEYASIAGDSTIGTIEGDLDTCIKALVAHEIAHWWHHNLLRKQHGAGWGRYKKDLDRPHGQRWQMIYRDLRSWFVNEDTRGINPFHDLEEAA